MKVLIVASYNNGRFAPFVTEQVQALEKLSVEFDFFGVTGKGFWGYLKNWRPLQKKIRSFKPDVIHAHYGLCGLLANLQRRVPVVTTYHGSDINLPKVLRFSKMAMRWSAWNIFVSVRNVEIAGVKQKYTLLPCGVDLEDYPPISKSEARQMMQLDEHDKYILFAGAFTNRVKNASLAQAAVAKLTQDVTLLELKGYTRQQVALLFYAVDTFLMTSYTEGSPQVIKEAMVCGCPVVSVDVGDVVEVIEGVNGCYIAERTPEAIAEALSKALDFKGKTNGRERILELNLTNSQIAERLNAVYALIKC